MKLVYSYSAGDDSDRLDPQIALRVLDKLEWFANSPNPLFFAKPLKDMSPATHRFRVGNYRILVAVKEDELWVLAVKHRKEVYLWI